MRTLHVKADTLESLVGQEAVTVRNGDKWADSLGQQIELCTCGRDGSNHRIVGHASVTSIWTGTMSEIPARLVERLHREPSRVYSGLMAAMRRAYGEDYPESSTVNALTYVRTD